MERRRRPYHNNATHSFPPPPAAKHGLIDNGTQDLFHLTRWLAAVVAVSPRNGQTLGLTRNT